MVRGIRGAITVERDEPELVHEAVRELLLAMLAENGIDDHDCIAAIFFTTTGDLTSTFPAAAARTLGMNAVPLMGMAEIDIPGGTPRVVRVMIQVNTRRRQAEMRHVYLRGAASLRPDLAAAAV